MDYGPRLAFFLACLLSVPSPVKSDRREQARTVDPAVARLVEPILDTLTESGRCSIRDESFKEADRLLGSVLQLQTGASDEALVILLHFYIGESSSEDVLHEITTRGRRMLPCLRRYYKRAPVFANRSYPPCLALKSRPRMHVFNEAMRAIRSNTVIGED
jgi:hypothetical protein